MDNQKKIMKFDLSNKNLKIKKLLNKDFLVVEMKAISNAYPNRNMSHFTKEAMEKAIPTFYNKPILGAFITDKNDFDGHNGDLVYDKELDEAFYDYTEEGSETPLGLIREQDNIELYQDLDGLYWIKFTCALWCKYSYRAIKRLLKSPNGKHKISVEVDVTKWHMEDKIEIIDEFVFDGCTILGDEFETGIASAEMTIVDMVSNALFQKKQKCLSFAYNALENKDTKVFSDELTQVSDPAVSNEYPKEEISMEVGQTTTEKESSMLDEKNDVIQVEDSKVIMSAEDNKPEDDKDSKKETEACEDTKEVESCENDDCADNKETESCEDTTKEVESCDNKEVESAEDDKDTKDEDDKKDEECKMSAEDECKMSTETECNMSAEDNKTEEPETDKECKMSEDSQDDKEDEPKKETESDITTGEHFSDITTGEHFSDITTGEHFEDNKDEDKDEDKHDDKDTDHDEDKPEDDHKEDHCVQFVMIGEEKCDINSLYEKFCALSESYTQINADLEFKKSEFDALNEKYSALTEKFKSQEAEEYISTANAMIDNETRIYSADKKQEIKNLVSEKCHKFEFANVDEVKKFTVATLAMTLYEQPVQDTSNENKDTFSVNITTPINAPSKKVSSADALKEVTDKLKYI